MDPKTLEFVELDAFRQQVLAQLRETKEPTPEELDVRVAELTQDWPRFHIGQEFELNGVVMRVCNITRHELILRPTDNRELEPS